jgi:hypothetical protein
MIEEYGEEKGLFGKVYTKGAGEVVDSTGRVLTEGIGH